jgi:predicted Rdx family selenoprotein
MSGLPKTMWARAILMRYGDLIRNSQMQWYMKSAWMANALDQGFHRYVNRVRPCDVCLNQDVVS